MSFVKYCMSWRGGPIDCPVKSSGYMRVALGQLLPLALLRRLQQQSRTFLQTLPLPKILKRTIAIPQLLLIVSGPMSLAYITCTVMWVNGVLTITTTVITVPPPMPISGDLIPLRPLRWSEVAHGLTTRPIVVQHPVIKIAKPVVVIPLAFELCASR